MGLKPRTADGRDSDPAIHRRAMHNPALQCRVPEPNMFSPALQCRDPAHPYQFFYLNSSPKIGEVPEGGKGMKHPKQETKICFFPYFSRLLHHSNNKF